MEKGELVKQVDEILEENNKCTIEVNDGDVVEVVNKGNYECTTLGKTEYGDVESLVRDLHDYIGSKGLKAVKVRIG